MTRCSHCSSNGHNSRTCSTRAGGGLRLFGVRLTDGSFIKKSASMGSLVSIYSAGSAAGDSPDGYHSDCPTHGSPDAADAFHRVQRKKGIPWTEEEHRKFLHGLQKLGKGDWRGISKNYVPSRSPTQVASHAQKYFIRQSNTNRRKKRSSLLDIAPNMETNSSSMPAISRQVVAATDEKRVVSSSQGGTSFENSLPSLALTLKPAFMPSPFQLWPSNTSSPNLVKSSAQVLKKEPVMGMSHLTLGEAHSIQLEPSSLSLRLPGQP